jgi:hypothetical protein
MEPYLVCVFLRPTPKQAEDGEVAILVVPATTVLAKDNNQAAVKAMKLVGSEYDGKEERLEVRVLPFQKCCR